MGRVEVVKSLWPNWSKMGRVGVVKSLWPNWSKKGRVGVVKSPWTNWSKMGRVEVVKSLWPNWSKRVESVWSNRPPARRAVRRKPDCTGPAAGDGRTVTSQSESIPSESIRVNPRQARSDRRSNPLIAGQKSRTLANPPPRSPGRRRRQGVRDGAAVGRQGEAGEDMYVVLSGALRATVDVACRCADRVLCMTNAHARTHTHTSGARV